MFTSTLEFERETPGSDAELTSAPPRLSNAQIADGLEQIGRLHTHEGRRRSLFAAATSIRLCSHPLAVAIADAGLEAVHVLGIGYELSGVVTDWVRTGRLPWLSQLRARKQEALTAVPGIGPRTAKELREVLGVVDAQGLLAAARDGRLLKIYGFGAKRVALIERLLGGAAEGAAQAA
jgi:DNA polymerase (family 10)